MIRYIFKFIYTFCFSFSCYSEYMFGKGIYLADMYEKSINYCDTFIDKSNPKKIKTYSYILLCEAALGNIYNASDINLDVENLPFLKKGYNSLKSCSDNGPDLNKNFICNNYSENNSIC